MLLSISVVSHGQMTFVTELMDDIQKYCSGLKIEFILTLNLDESIPFHESDFFYTIKIIRNTKPVGFGANHNRAFRVASGRFFCVANPDIRFESDPFPELFNGLVSRDSGVAAPLVLGPNGEVEDSVRCFPTPGIIFAKLFRQRNFIDYSIGVRHCKPDWVGGMFMLFPRAVFQQLNGFDERYFLYYEDVDLCARLRLAGYQVTVCPNSRVIHYAQRRSHRSLKYLRWHLASMLRFFLSPVYRRLSRKNA